MPPKKYKKKELSVSINAKFLVIVESPSKCAKIEHYLGSNFACIASIGHLRNINGLKSIDTKNSFEPTFSFIKEKEGHIDSMRKIINKFPKQNVILASDDDREGEAIAWHICEIFDLPIESTKRIIFHEITKNAIIHAVENPTIINMKLVKSQQARQILDIIVGYKISPYLWTHLYNNKDNSLSAGRCQTPALRLVYENEQNKDTNISFTHKIKGIFTNKQLLFDLTHEFDNVDNIQSFLETSKTFNHELIINKPKDTEKKAPKPYHTSSLLQNASNILHYSPKETMSLCQQLYQNGYITYMRTESNKYSKVFVDNMNKYIQKKYNEQFIGNNELITNNDNTNPHEAIRVTQIEVKNITSENSRLSTLYKFIWKNTVESCMANAKYQNIQLKLTAPLKFHYSHTIENPIFYGWKIISENKDCNTVQNDNNSLLLYLRSLTKIDYIKIDSFVSYHNKHTYYTESSLIKKLENIGIGRPSTFASIVDTIQERNYVKKQDLEGIKINCTEYTLQNNIIKKNEAEKTFGNEKNKLIIQPIGILSIDFLTKYFQELFSYEYTENMETILDKISGGEEDNWSSICNNCYNQIKTLSKGLSKLKKLSFEIEPNYDIVFECYGPTIKHNKNDGTTEYIPLIPGTEINLDKLKNNEYKLNELINTDKEDSLGTYENEQIFIKTGRYGDYVQWGDNKESLKNLKTPIKDITHDIIVQFLNNKKDNPIDKNILRVINEDISIRKGKFGPYLFYKTSSMKKPEFYNIKKFKDGYLSCDKNILIDWLNNTYKLQLTL
tara:strand:+ start:2737 stop:5088 length:2352 start_codon:yes stop_codon:yes gene_type:complete